jgi:aminoglycoside phosphotransferase family enzyme/predicted kinase
MGGMGNPMITALLQPRAYPHLTSCISLLETHISWVILTGTYAYKLKKPVNLGFVDFSSLERRRHFCQEELRLNQRLAPQLYLDLVEVHGPAEQANLLGQGPLIEVAVRMRQFEQEDLLPRALAAGTLTGEQLENFAERLAVFHSASPQASAEGPFGTPEAVVAPALANLEVLQRLQPGLTAQASLAEWTHQEARRLQSVFAERLARGRIREGHGDLHLGNLVLHQGEVVGFDCLEFNPALRWIDVVSDLAFLAMDLRHSGKRIWAGRLLNRWLIACGDYDALHTWPWYLTYRALVRAKVLALRLEQRAGVKDQTQRNLVEQLDRYWQLALQTSGASGSGALLLTQGVSGSGKSHLANQLCQRHGWIHLRSDVERRRLFGRWGSEVNSPRQGDAYSPALTAEIYGEILPVAATAAVQAGETVVVDATFLKKQQRARFLRLARQLQVPCLILVCPITPELAQSRIEARNATNKDPSEADVSVLSRQWSDLEPLDEGEFSHHILCGEIDQVDRLLQERLPMLFKTTR